MNIIKSPLYNTLKNAGARFVERDGALVAASLSDLKTEYQLVRSTFGITDFSHVLKYRTEDEDALYDLDELLAGNVANIRYGRVLHTFLADKDGELKADVFVASNDEEILVFCETCCPPEEIDNLLRNKVPSLKNITEELALISLDGPLAYTIPADLLDRDTLGMPYLSVEDHTLDGVHIRLLRAGKTGEFGYLLAVSKNDAEAVWQRIVEEGAAHKAGICGLEVFDLLKMDGRFFNINREGREVRDPLSLGLQWMIDFDKEAFSGQEAILARREQGVTQKIIGIALAEGLTGMIQGSKVACDGEVIGTIITSGFSYTLNCEMGLALLNVEVAYSGLKFTVDGMDSLSISLPPFMPTSLTVKLDEV